MADSNSTKNAPADDFDDIPIAKTNPLIWVAIIIVVVVGGGIGTYVTMSNSKKHDAEAKAMAEKIKKQEAELAKKRAAIEYKKEHLKLSVKAFQEAAQEDKKEKAAAAAKAKQEEEEKKMAEAAKHHGGGTAHAGGGHKKQPSSNDLNELNKLGSATNSALNGK